MPTTTSTNSFAMNTLASSTSSTARPSSTSTSSSGTGTQPNATTPTRTATIQHQQPTTPSTATSTPPTSRSSTPSIPAATTSNPSPLHTDKQRLNRLSHISTATWLGVVGVVLGLAGLIVSIYVAMAPTPVSRLDSWTANNYFRESCKTETALPQTSACKEALEQPPEPPPTMRKRMAMAVYKHSHWGLRLALATCCMSLVLLSKNSTRRGRARLPLLLFRLPLVSLMIFICSDVYAQGDHWSGMSQRGSIWKAVRILIAFTALQELPLLDMIEEQRQVALMMFGIYMASWMGLVTTGCAWLRRKDHDWMQQIMLAFFLIASPFLAACLSWLIMMMVILLRKHRRTLPVGAALTVFFIEYVICHI